MSFFDPKHRDLLPPTQWPSWPLASLKQQCDHCYCLDSDVESYRDDPHKACCKCDDVRAARFVGIDGRAVGKA